MDVARLQRWLHALLLEAEALAKAGLAPEGFDLCDRGLALDYISDLREAPGPAGGQAEARAAEAMSTVLRVGHEVAGYDESEDYADLLPSTWDPPTKEDPRPARSGGGRTWRSCNSACWI
jgi:hypothetical protein